MKNKLKGFVVGVIMSTVIVSTAIASGALETIQVAMNSITVKVNGAKVNADNFVYKGTTYVPLRASGEILGKYVSWDQATNTANINDKPINNQGISQSQAHDILIKKYGYHPMVKYVYVPGGGHTHDNSNVLNDYHVFKEHNYYESEGEDYYISEEKYCVDKKTGRVREYDPLGFLN